MVGRGDPGRKIASERGSIRTKSDRQVGRHAAAFNETRGYMQGMSASEISTGEYNSVVFTVRTTRGSSHPHRPSPSGKLNSDAPQLDLSADHGRIVTPIKEKQMR